MTMKQTQTKLFDFSDVGLDFCAGSKNLFPTVFKKMLAQGYNPQTVSSVSVSGNQVVFTYGTNHGYVADRVLKVDSGVLALINNGEFWINSVTANTVTMTIDGVSGSISGGFGTKIAPLGWSLEYEVANVQIYRMKQLNESDCFVRLCFQNNTSRKNLVGVCVGKSFSYEDGIVTDEDSIVVDRNTITPITNGQNWVFGSAASNTHNNYTYSQGFTNYGKAIVVGSKYHFIAMYNNGSAGTNNTLQGATISAILPAVTHSYTAQLPVLIAQTGIDPSNSNAIPRFDEGKANVGTLGCVFDNRGTSNPSLFQYPSASSSFTSLDGFNTTTAEPIPIFESNTGQHVGYIAGCLYRCRYAATETAPSVKQSTPALAADIDLDAIIYTHPVSFGSTTLAQSVFIAVVIEEIKIGA